MSTKLGLTLFAFLFTVVAGLSWWGIHKEETPATPTHHVALELKVPTEFRFVAFGDTRFHDPLDTQPANPAVRKALVAAIDQEHPQFVSIGGDIVYSGDNANDWAVWDTETKTWRDHSIPVYPALGNHDLKGNLNTALGNYFARFPQLDNSRFYSVRMGNSLMLILDSSLDETTGPQGDWLRDQLDALPAGLDFVFLVLHHPLYTSSSDEKIHGGGHSARSPEQALAKMLEERQKQLHARIIVFSGHVHNYERHEHNGVTYFVTGGGGARPYIIPRAPGDLYKDPGINYHYLLVLVRPNSAEITMNKLELKDGKELWSRPDSVTLTPPAAVLTGAHAH
jgi:Icc-related predicted phosphoesterase